MADWDLRFVNLASHIATWSKDLSTHVGCVVAGPDHEIISTGYNGIPRGVKDRPSRMERPAKYLWTSHAEENAIAHAARIGVSVRGATAYVTHHPCCRCARALIQAGISRIVYPVSASGTVGIASEEFQIAADMFGEAGISIVLLDD